MKRFVTILLLALAAVLTTCTPCEAKRHDRAERKRFEAMYKRWCENMRLYSDMGYSNDGNIHLFSWAVSFMKPKPPSRRMVDWYTKIAPRGVTGAITEATKTYFHYEDGTVVEVKSYEQLANIKSELYD